MSSIPPLRSAEHSMSFFSVINCGGLLSDGCPAATTERLSELRAEVAQLQDTERKYLELDRQFSLLQRSVAAEKEVAERDAQWRERVLEDQATANEAKIRALEEQLRTRVAVDSDQVTLRLEAATETGEPTSLRKEGTSDVCKKRSRRRIRTSETQSNWMISSTSLDMSSYFKLWARCVEERAPSLFNARGVRLSVDGGLSDVDELMYPLQYIYAFLIIGFCIANVYMIQKLDWEILLDRSESDMARASDEWLFGKEITNFLLRLVGLAQPKDSGRLVFVVELLVMYGLLLRIVLRLVHIFLASSIHRWKSRMGLTSTSVQDADFYRWTAVAHLCWHNIPQLATFSAMRLLYFITPSVISTQGYECFFLVKEQWHKVGSCCEHVKVVMPMLWFVISRSFGFIAGFDAFVMKLRLAATVVAGNTVEIEDVLELMVLLFQILGIVNLNWFVRERLSIFIFGGEDGNMDIEEMTRWHVWKALLAKQVFTVHGLFRGTVVMLGFDDYDLQMLVWDDHRKEEKMERKATEKRKSSKSSKEGGEFQSPCAV